MAGDIKTAIFVDAANMFYAQRDNGWHIQYRKVLEHFSRDRELYAAYYFTGTPPADRLEQIEKYRRFRMALVNMGYTVVDKEVKVLTDAASGTRKLKGNLDVEMTMHLLVDMPHYDEAVILGGDSDFVKVLEHLRNSGKQIICVGRRQSMSWELKNLAHKFVDLNEIRKQIEKK